MDNALKYTLTVYAGISSGYPYPTTKYPPVPYPAEFVNSFTRPLPTRLNSYPTRPEPDGYGSGTGIPGSSGYPTQLYFKDRPTFFPKVKKKSNL